ncbi:MAG: 3-deoxy-manno-octulosonate cytidylyltransferase [Deltaproteobacteria bacterium]|nr:3-deoxy-manno-octulosonate cytidylyltransferase [Deltaproteobacteria bacterium]
MKVYAIIPARYGSTRFEGKPLAMIAGRPMIQHVYERAKTVASVDQVVVATDDERIRSVVEGFKGEAVMTRTDHATGTDRLAEAIEILDAGPEDIVVNIQGDQPAFHPRLITEVIQPLKNDPSLTMTTPAVPLTNVSEASDPNIVKVVFDQNHRALYFSRAPIPWPRDGEETNYFRHIGVYGYRVEFLCRFVSLPQGRLEVLERLEQLRALEHGYPIKVIITDLVSPDVDVPSDIARVEEFLKNANKKFS